MYPAQPYQPAPARHVPGSDVFALAVVLLAGLGWIVGSATVPHRPMPHLAGPALAEPDPEAAAGEPAPAARSPETAPGLAGVIGGRPARDRPQQGNGQCYIDPATGQQTCPGAPIGGLFRRR